MKDLDGKVAVVTGGGSGIGAAIVRRLVDAGMRVAVADIERDAASSVADEVGEGARAFEVDITQRESLAALADGVERDLGPCRVLCANAGVLQMGRLDSRSPEDWDWVLSVNVRGTIQTVDAFLPQMRRADGASQIVITSSMAGLIAAGPGKGVYNVSKHAQMAYGETLRAELADEGIGVSLLLPAGTQSRIVESGRNRPEALGESKVSAEDLQTITSAVGTTETVTADYAVRNLVRGITDDATWIVTHTAQRQNVEERFRRILAAFDAAEDAESEANA